MTFSQSRSPLFLTFAFFLLHISIVTYVAAFNYRGVLSKIKVPFKKHQNELKAYSLTMGSNTPTESQYLSITVMACEICQGWKSYLALHQQRKADESVGVFQKVRINIEEKVIKAFHAEQNETIVKAINLYDHTDSDETTICAKVIKEIKCVQIPITDTDSGTQDGSEDTGTDTSNDSATAQPSSPLLTGDFHPKDNVTVEQMPSPPQPSNGVQSSQSSVQIPSSKIPQQSNSTQLIQLQSNSPPPSSPSSSEVKVTSSKGTDGTEEPIKSMSKDQFMESPFSQFKLIETQKKPQLGLNSGSNTIKALGCIFIFALTLI